MVNFLIKDQCIHLDSLRYPFNIGIGWLLQTTIDLVDATLDLSNGIRGIFFSKSQGYNEVQIEAHSLVLKIKKRDVTRMNSQM